MTRKRQLKKMMMMTSHSNGPDGQWRPEEMGWEQLEAVAELIGARPQTVLSWSIHDKDWPCGAIFREIVGNVTGARERKEKTIFRRYWLAPGSLDLLVKIYPKRINAKTRKVIQEENSFLKERLEQLEGLVESLVNDKISDRMEPLAEQR